MIRIRLDRFALGELAEEVKKSPQVVESDRYIGMAELQLPLLVDNAKVIFYSVVSKLSGVLPPPFQSLGGIKHE